MLFFQQYVEAADETPKKGVQTFHCKDEATLDELLPFITWWYHCIHWHGFYYILFF
jgi:hypothetical protein